MLYFIRHGESLSNIGHKHIYDSPLTDKGREQAANLTGHVDHIICSPLRRAKETLICSNISYSSIEINNMCREKKCGIPSSLLFEELDEQSTQDYIIRLQNLCKHIISCTKLYNTIAIICHKCVIASLTGITPDNCSIIPGNFDVINSIANGGDIYFTKCCAGSN